MKTWKSIIACLCVTGSVFGQSNALPKGGAPKPEEKATRHYILVPPWACMRGKPNRIAHEEARKAIKKWADEAPEFTGSPLVFDTTSETDEPMAGGNGFVANLTPSQAKALKWRFTFGNYTPQPKKLHTELFVGPDLEFEPLPLTPGAAIANSNPIDVKRALAPDKAAPRGKSPSKDTDPLARSSVAANSTNWAVCDTIPTPVTVTQTNTPVLYVVDTGVQPLVQTGSTWGWNADFQVLGSNTNCRFRLLQGRLATGLGASWPPSSTALNPWHYNQSGNPSGTQSGQPLVFNSTNAPLKPCTTATTGYTALAAPYQYDPQIDPIGHGTKLVCTALGLNMGFLGSVSSDSNGTPVAVDVESIRIYKNATGSNTIASTNSSSVADGIFKAVNEHRFRIASNANARSVLLFASRSTSGFTDNVEVALWWAWCNGVICVISSGNEPSANSGGMQSPNAIWYSGITNNTHTLPSIQPTTPSRFDWTQPNGNTTKASYWPAPTPTAPIEGGTANVPCPNEPYLVLVAGHGITYSSNAYGGNDAWHSGSSKGPEVDIIAPCNLVPTLQINSATNTTTTGSSLSSGFVAGVALAYAATTAPSNPASQAGDHTIPNNFLNWLTPSGGPGTACAQSTAGPWGTGNFRISRFHNNSAYGSKIPKLKVTAIP